MPTHERPLPECLGEGIRVGPPQRLGPGPAPVDELGALGLPIITPPTRGLEPGVAAGMRFRDPEGNLVELITGVDAVRDAYGNRDVKPVGLNHIVLECQDRIALEYHAQVAVGGFGRVHEQRRSPG